MAEQGFGVLTEIDMKACNVVVRADTAEPGAVIVEAMNPQLTAEVTGQPALAEIADEVARKLQAAVDSLAGGSG